MQISIRFLLISHLLFTQACAQPSATFPEVKIEGAMREVMWNGAIEARVSLDSLHPGSIWYGLGPLANLRGEITVLDGVVYKSEVDSFGMLVVRRDSLVGAPFFVHCGRVDWEKHALPDSLRNMREVEGFLNEQLAGVDVPIPYMLQGFWSEAHIHAVNLPKGSIVRSPDEAHEGLTPYQIFDLNGTAIGFYSRNHHAVFTHHDTNMHTHFVSDNRRWMGHLDSAEFSNKQLSIWLPRGIKP